MIINSDYTVLGTGPVGVLAAKLILNKGHSVTILDNSTKRSKKITERIHLKDIKNKAYVYDYSKSALDKSSKPMLPISSKAKGGFSEVWGATLMTLASDELLKLGLDENKIKKYYSLALSDIPHNAHEEFQGVECSSCNETLEIDPQFINIYNHLELNKKNLNKKKIFFQKSILAINTSGWKNLNLIEKEHSKNLVWSSKNLLDELIRDYPGQIQYVNSLDVKNIEESGDSFSLVLSTGTCKVNSKKIFIATGAFSSTLLASNMTKRERYKFFDSSLAIYPIIWLGKASKYSNSPVALSQIFFEIREKNKVFQRAQLYAFNQDVANNIKYNYPIFGEIIVYFLRIIKKRLFFMFVYNDSENSSYAEFIIKNNSAVLYKIHNKKLKFLRNNLLHFLSVKCLVLPIRKKFKIFGSFHSGATIPMTQDINDFDGNKSDMTGRVKKDSNIHFIDSSILPFVPSGPITLTTVANGLRIVDEVTDV
jgi:hypothetical protein